MTKHWKSEQNGKIFKMLKNMGENKQKINTYMQNKKIFRLKNCAKIFRNGNLQ